MRTVFCKANNIIKCVNKHRYLSCRRRDSASLSIDIIAFKRNFSLYTMDQVHEKTKTGFLDGQNYERSRPSYTDEVVGKISSIIQEELPGTTHSYDCLELGAGTGKFTEKIIKCLPKGIKYLATEPMSGFLDMLKAKCTEVEAMQFSADKIPLPDTSVKTVVAAQCFHWFATKEALNEIYRVLVPNGKFVLVWNHKLRTVPWLDEIDVVVTENYGDTPRALNYTWKRLMDEYPKFKCIQHSTLDGIKWQGSREDIVSHFESISVISSLDSETKPVVLQKFRDIIDKHFDKNISEIDMPFETELYVCSKV